MRCLHFNSKPLFLTLAIVFFLLSFVQLFTKPTYAANGINRTINFQGKLVKNSDGTNVSNTSYTVTFALYNHPTAGNTTAGYLWKEQQTVTTVDGIFRVALGSSTAFPANFNFNWDGLYLGITVSPDSSEMTPRIQMAAVPFAFNAQQVAGLTVQDTSGNASTSGILQVANAVTVKLPTSGTGLIYADAGATGTLANLTNSTSQTGGVIGLALSLSGANGSYAQTGLQFNLSSATSGTALDIQGTSNTWGITRAGAFAANNIYGNNGDCLKSGGSATSVMSWGTCGGGGTNWWNEFTGALSSVNTKDDLLLGGSSTSSAVFAFTGLSTPLHQTQASISGNLIVMPNNGFGGTVGIGTTNPISEFNLVYAGGDTGIAPLTIDTSGSTANSTPAFKVILQNSTTSGQSKGFQIANSGFATAWASFEYNIGASNNPGLGLGVSGNARDTYITRYAANTFLISADGTINTKGFLDANTGLAVGLGSNTQLAALDVRGGNFSGTAPAASISAKTSFAGLVVDQAGVGDILTASAAGSTRFSIAQNGSVLFQGPTLTSIGSGASGTGSNAVTNAIGDQGSLVPNAGFESNMLGGTVADGWFIASNSAYVTRDNSVVAKGNFSIKFTLNASQGTAIYSSCIPLGMASGLGLYNVYFYERSSTLSTYVRVYVDGYTSQASCRSDSSTGRVFSAPLGGANAAVNTWYTKGGTTTAMTGVTWARAHVYVGCPASCASGNTVNIDGVRIIESSLTGGLDYAENYPADPNNLAAPGDVVLLTSANGSAQVIPADKPMDQSVIGVVSTNPGQVLDDSSILDPKVTVALAGRTPVKVSSKNGPIQIGDYLASSDIPGVAVKATMAGPVIGTAMEDYTDPDPQSIGKVVIFIKNTYFNGVSVANSGLNLNGKDSSVILAMVKDSANSENSISLSLTKDGQFAIKDGNGNSVITFDNQGNAYFKGVIVADKIKANQIEGLDIFTNRISALEANTAVLSASTRSAELATISASLPLALTLTSPNVDGLATVSGDLNVDGTGFIQGALNVLDNITTNNLLVSQFAYFINDVVFKGTVRFNDTPVFSSDTAGFAVIKKDSDSVAINFGQEYVDMPIVTASIALDKMEDSVVQKQLEDLIFNGNISFVITQRTTQGFVIRLNKPAPEDINFSWVALSVQKAQTSGITPPAPTPDPSSTTSAAFQSITNQLNQKGGASQ